MDDDNNFPPMILKSYH